MKIDPNTSLGIIYQQYDEDNKNDWAWYIDVYDFMD